MIIRGVDTDNYDGVVSVERYAALKSKGFDFNIVGAQIGLDGRNYTDIQIANSRAGGLLVPATYELLYWDSRDISRMAHAASFGLPVWVDCEYETGGRSQAWIVNRIAEAVEFLAGHCAGIYTGGWWWRPATGNSDRFSYLPLWHAQYTWGMGVLPPLDYVPDFGRDWTPYGGWTRPTMYQYADVAHGERTFDENAWEIQGDPTLEVRLDRAGQRVTIGQYVVEYASDGVPIWRFGGVSPGATAKNFGGVWVYLRNPGDGRAVWSVEAGD